jgi:TetR/AcrR family transcriptional regulator, lmrAB and yxaGH operons repressor
MGRPRLDIEVNSVLSRMFRQRGYDGMSLSDFERETGMAKASLYYRFPEGKDSMARAVLTDVATAFEQGLLAQMDEAAPAQALRLFEKGLLAYYENGQLGCLLGAFAMQHSADRFRTEMQALVKGVTAALISVQLRLGVPKKQALARTEDFLADLQGSLILAAVSGKPAAFKRRLKAAISRLGAAA